MTAESDRTSKDLLVNLGCGLRFHPAWSNYDLTPASEQVKRANFFAGIPLPDRSAACVYHSHLLEHLPREMARDFLIECRRVLKPGGVLRIVVPDLEATARDYLRILDLRRAGQNLPRQHLWMLVELFDQMVRTRRGGMMGQMIREAHDQPALADFIAPRLGADGAALRNSASPRGSSRGKLEKLQDFFSSFGYPGRVLAEVVFRKRGEIHQWMYDELFLGDVLRDAGYVQVVRQTHDTSQIPRWSEYHLDTESDGSPYKGISLYMEAQRAAPGNEK